MAHPSLLNIQIDRQFVRINSQLLHLRHISPEDPCTHSFPILMLHASPGSGRVLAPLMQQLHHLCPQHRIIAPDTPGHGDSDGYAHTGADMNWYAQQMLHLADALGLEHFLLYGTHTGARLACALAHAAPDRVSALIVDGLTTYSPELQAELLSHYAPPVQPDAYGQYLVWAFHYIRDQSLHFPHYARDPAHRLLTRSVPYPETLHLATLDLLKALTTYHHAYHAAFSYDCTQVLPQLSMPTLFFDAVGELPELRAAVAALAHLTPHSQIASVDGSPAAKAQAIQSFLTTEATQILPKCR